jgi:cobalt-zinc-cadmium resistance protein CzcA
VRLDRRALARYGMNADHALETIQAVGGAQVGVVLEGQPRYALQVRVPPSLRDRPEQLGNLLLVAPRTDGGEARLVPLDEVADLVIENGPAQISREAISRRITVELNVRDRDIASFVAEAQAAVDAQVELPPGWYIDWGGQFENLAAASQRLAILVPLALLLIFVLLYSSFNSGRLAALIYLNVPMAVTGGIFALFLRGYPFSIAVLNGVVLVSYIVEMREHGRTPDEAAAEAARIRLRPVLMTAMVASFGFIPMALATSAGGEVQRPLATVVIGGLVTSTLLTLVVLPAVYRWFAKKSTDIELRPRRYAP